MHIACPLTVQLSTTDPDGDRVTCRFAHTELECGELCQRFPYFDLNEVISVKIRFMRTFQHVRLIRAYLRNVEIVV